MQSLKAIPWLISIVVKFSRNFFIQKLWTVFVDITHIRKSIVLINNISRIEKSYDRVILEGVLLYYMRRAGFLAAWYDVSWAS